MATSAVRRAIDGGMRLRMAFQDGELKLIAILAEEAGKIIELPGPMDAYDDGSLSKRLQATTEALYAEAMRIARRTLADAYESVAQEIEAFAEKMQRLDEEASAALDMDLRAAEDWARRTAEEISARDAFSEYAEAQETIARVERDIDTAIRAGLIYMQRDADDVYRQVINAARDAGQADWSALRTNAKRALDDFAEQGVTGFTDKLGRRWGLPEYVDMALRTGAQRASLGAVIAGMMAHGMDLCYVNAHKGCCEKCLKWQGVILSLRGAPGYPSLAEAMADGLFHPNCGHILQVYLKGYSHPGIGAPEGYTEEQNAELYLKRQKQRSMERQLRKWKRLQAAAMTPEDERIAQAHVKLWQRRIREHIDGDIDLPRRYDREGGRVTLSEEAKKLKPLQIGENGGIITPVSTNAAGGEGVQFVCRIDREIYSCVSKDIVSDIVILRTERIQHIQDHHPNDYERYGGYIREMVEQPDYIVETDRPKTAFILKSFDADGQQFRLILRLNTIGDDPNFENSIITFQYVRPKEYLRLIRNKKVLYKRDGL